MSGAVNTSSSIERDERQAGVADGRLAGGRPRGMRDENKQFLGNFTER
jgi:hypothetical protein